jgi:hypothetical protein
MLSMYTRAQTGCCTIFMDRDESMKEPVGLFEKSAFLGADSLVETTYI